MPPPRPAWRGSAYPAWGRVGHPGSPPRRTRTHAGHRVLAFGQSRCKNGTPRGTGVTWDGKGRPSAAVVLPGPSSIAASHRRPRQRREVGRTQRTRCRWVTPSVTHPPPPSRSCAKPLRPVGLPGGSVPWGAGRGPTPCIPEGEPTGRYGHGGDAAGTAPARLGWPRECHVPRMGTMALAPSLNPQGPRAGYGAHGGPGPAPVPGSARLEGDALGLSIPPGEGATAWFEASPLAGPWGHAQGGGNGGERAGLGAGWGGSLHGI